MKKLIVLSFLTVLSLSAFAQYPTTATGVFQFQPVDSSYKWRGTFARKDMMWLHDSLRNGPSYVKIIANQFWAKCLDSSNVAGVNTNIVYTDNKGRFKVAPIQTVKRQVPYSSSSNASGVVTVTFSPAFAVAPNIQYNLGNGANNKETCVMTSLSASSVSFLVQLRSDVLGLLPTYAAVIGRNVDVLATEK